MRKAWETVSTGGFSRWFSAEPAMDHQELEKMNRVFKPAFGQECLYLAVG